MISENELNEKNIEETKNLSQKKIEFMYSLFDTFSKIKEIKNVDDIYLNFGSDNLEVYCFLKESSLDDEDEVSKLFSMWEMNQLCFPELFIFSNEDKKLNVLPRTANKVL